ncbi:hypothetical protein Glove_227g23 [Diversispora epigaea]|uniref:Tyrosine--tRNA ligase SYY-like C-terminal domain-containing protein n=1 Tax=Diversispora epigaea TaxID=1348612 RepID=A0A397IDS2_9GLOM|nr:hypothetical protein Glove_227g23 [Diversispora epigaea]
MFTFLKDEEISQILKTHFESPEKHYAQEKLASEITEMVHGLIGLKKAKLATNIMFGTPIKDLCGQEIVEAFENDTQLLTIINRNEILNCSMDRVAVSAGACKSRTEANKLIKSGGFYLNNERVKDPQHKLVESDLLDGILCIFRTGKSNYRLVKVID